MAWKKKADIRGPRGYQGDRGAPGPQGLPGPGAVSNDDAVAGLLAPGATSKTKDAFTTLQALSAPPVPARTPSAVTAVACWGDSITEIGMGVDSYSDIIARLTGLPVYNGGKWGQSSPQIAARQGGAPALITFPGALIPASGSASVTVSPNPLGGSYSGSRAGVVHGVAGTLAWTAGATNLTFTRTTPGAAVALSGPVKFMPSDGTDPVNRTAVQIFWIGRNGAQDVTGNTAALQRMVGYANARFLVLSVLPWAGQASPDATNYAYQEAFPEQYRDIGAWLRSQAAADAAGITFTADDQNDISAGAVPRSFRQDDVHPNASGRLAIGTYLAGELVKLGWASAYSAPALPVPATNRWDLSGRPAGAVIPAVAPLVGTLQLAQTNTAQQPVAVADSLFKRNPARVDATLRIGTYLASTPSAATITVVGRLTDAADADGKLVINMLGVLLRVSGGKLGTYATSGGAVISSTSTADTQPHVITVVLNGATSAVWVDGVKVGTGTAAPSTAQLQAGAGAGFEILDWVLNTSALTDANITATASSLRSGYIK